MSENCSSDASRPCALTESWKVVSDGAGGGAEGAGGHLHVLLADGAHDVGRGQLPRRQLVGIEPDAHAVLAGAEDLHAADTRNARQLVLHLQVREVRQVQHVIALVGRDEVRHQQEVR
jgi:hypothetical protein